MTSLDFQAMLRQEKAKLLRDRSVRKPPTSAVTAAEDSAAAGATDDGSCIEEEEKSRAVYKNGDVSLSAGSPTTSLLFAELAGRPPLDMEKASARVFFPLHVLPPPHDSVHRAQTVSLVLCKVMRSRYAVVEKPGGTKLPLHWLCVAQYRH